MTTRGKHYSLARAELVNAITPYESFTTQDGTTNTLVDDTLNGFDDFITGKTIMIMDGLSGKETKVAASFDGVNTITITGNYNNPILKGTAYRVLTVGGGGGGGGGTASPTYDDSVYIDQGSPDAGILYPTGTAIKPVNNLTDAKTILANNRSVRLKPVGSGGLVLDQAINLIVDGIAALVGVDFNNQNVHGCIFRIVSITGANGGPNMISNFYYGCQLETPTNMGGFCFDCYVLGTVGVIGAGANPNQQLHLIRPYFDIEVPAQLDFTGCPATGKCVVEDFSGDFAVLNMADPGITLKISGKGGDVVTIDASNTAGVIDVYGNVKLAVDPAATVTVNDHTDKPQPEVPVNISAIVASPTDFLNLAAAGAHYTVDKVRLKAADPGADTITVVLKELVNGALIPVQSFVIYGSGAVLPNVPNWTTYFDLMDMFAIPSLAGDQEQITVQASGGVGYAVIGSYRSRSA